MSDGDDMAIAALDEVRTEVLSEFSDYPPAEATFHDSHAAVAEVTPHGTSSIMAFFSVLEQPLLNEGRYAALLRPDRRMVGIHFFAFLGVYLNDSRIRLASRCASS